MADYGYGIVDKDDNPWWGEDWCVCRDKDILDDECEALNNADETAPPSIRDPRRPYRVVKLTFRGKR